MSTRQEKIQALEKQWAENPRWAGIERKKREGKCDIAWTVRPQKFKQTAQVVSSLRR